MKQNLAKNEIIITDVKKCFVSQDKIKHKKNHENYHKNSNVIAALQTLSVTLKPCGVIGLVGPDGAGKTTLLRMLAGLITPTEGTISVIGFDPTTEGEYLRSQLGYMPQKFGLYEDLTVQENLDLFASLRNIDKSKRTALFKQLLDFTNLGKFTNRFAGKLSGGMKQKLGLACTLLGNPRVLLLDEPGVGVDPISRLELWAMVHKLADEGMLIIWSTSYLDEAQQCQDLLLLNKGKLLFRGRPQELTEKVNHRVFLISKNQNDALSHRQLLRQALLLDQVSDGVIEGENIRLIFKQAISKRDIPLLFKHTKIIAKEIEGRFEDAFIDLLGGVAVKESVLTKIMPPIDCSKQEIVIEAKSLTKKFGSFIATNQVNFDVKRGEIFGLLGPNGAGKSTIFKMMCGLLSITEGQALVLDLDLKQSTIQIREHLGYMAQRFSLYDKLTVKQNLKFFSGIYGLSGKRQKISIDEMISAFDFTEILNRTPESLPLGYKQRLALACALMHKPDILFLDEPTSGVDPITRREFWIHINSLVEKGVTVMVTTHFMDEAEYCDRIGLVNNGQLIALGTPNKLKRLICTESMPNPTMEKAFIELILQSRKQEQADIRAEDENKRRQ